MEKINTEKKHPSWNDVFNKEEYHYGESPNLFIKEHLKKIKPGGKVLCLGSGEGRNAVYLAKKGFLVRAVDYADSGLEKTKKLADKNKVDLEIEKADLKKYQIKEEEYDAIICVFLHLPPEARKELAKKIRVGLKEGGLFIAEYYELGQMNYNTGGPKKEEMLMSMEKAREEFRGLTFHVLEKKKKIILEGSGHTGECMVLDLIAKK